MPVPTWSGTVYVAFVIDVHSRRILGWRAPGPCAPPWSWTPWRWRCGPGTVTASPTCPGWSTTTTTGQYTSLAFTERLAQAGAAPSVGRVGDALDNALAESEIGLFKTELIRRRGPWKGLDDAELATLEWVDWHNHRRLHTACQDMTPVEYEQIYYRRHPAQTAAEVSTT